MLGLQQSDHVFPSRTAFTAILEQGTWRRRGGQRPVRPAILHEVHTATTVGIVCLLRGCARARLAAMQAAGKEVLEAWLLVCCPTTIVSDLELMDAACFPESVTGRCPHMRGADTVCLHIKKAAKSALAKKKPYTRQLVEMVDRLAQLRPRCEAALPAAREFLLRLACLMANHAPRHVWTHDPLVACASSGGYLGRKRPRVDEDFKQAIVEQQAHQRGQSHCAGFADAHGVARTTHRGWSDLETVHTMAAGWLAFASSKIQDVHFMMDASRFAQPGKNLEISCAWAADIDAFVWNGPVAIFV